MASELDALRLQARELPQLPGIYFWRDAADRILYIGKAVNLRRRVLSYFNAARRDRRVRKLVTSAHHITFEVTETELEALFRESARIKEYQPEYNRMLRSPRRMWYIKLDASLEDPVMRVTSNHDSDGSLYFGPFPSGAMTRETAAFLHDVLPLRKCAAARPQCRPCIYLQMGKCAAPALGDEYRRRHLEAIARLHDLLQGRTDRVRGWLERKRDRLCESLLFEQAREVQQRLDLLGDYSRQQAILEAAVQCRCVVIRDMSADDCDDGKLLLVANGHVLSTRNAGDLSPGSLARWIVLHEPVIEAAAFEQNPIDAASVLQRWLRTSRQHLRWTAIWDDAGEQDLRETAEYLLAPRDVPALAAGA